MQAHLALLWLGPCAAPRHIPAVRRTATANSLEPAPLSHSVLRDQCESPGHVPATRRIAWFHPPKTGTSFGTLLVHMANASLPAEARMSTCSTAADAPTLTYDAYSDPDTTLVYDAHKCMGATDLFALRYSHDEFFRGVFWDSEDSSASCARPKHVRYVGEYELCTNQCADSCDFGQHRFVCEADFARFRGSFHGLWREPLRLAASNYVRLLDAGPNNSVVYDTSDAAFLDGLFAYANATRGRVTMLLAGAMPAAGDGSSVFPAALRAASVAADYAMFAPAKDDGTPPAQPLLPLATQRLLTGFAFVGMTDEFSLTACLFHLTFGGRCSEYELEDSRPTAGASTSDVAEILTAAGYADPIDEALYRVAKQRFDAEVRRLNATSARCASIQCTLDATSVV